MTLIALVNDIRERVENPVFPMPKTKMMLKALNSIETAQDNKTVAKSAGKIMVAANDIGIAYADKLRDERTCRSDFFHYGNLTIIEFLAEKILDGDYD